MATEGRVLVSPRTRSAFRDHCSDAGVIFQIARAFEDVRFTPAGVEDAPVPFDETSWYRNGQRRGTFDLYTRYIDWTDQKEVRRALNVFEEIYSWGGEEWGDQARQKLAAHLKRDGWRVDAEGRIRPTGPELAVPLEGLQNASAILEHLDRIADSTDSDPALAISGGKAVIEATSKLVLNELGVPFKERADVPELVKEAQKALKLHPETLAPTAKGREITIRILSNLSQLAIGVAELRNEYGPDHGRSKAVVGLGPRHAHLAVGAATTYARLLIETLEARRVAAS
jgi:hypothetical protein